MKRQLLTTLIILTLGFTTILTGCTQPQGDETPMVPIKVATLNGPTGIGMTYMMENPEKYQISIYQSPDELVSKVVTGEVDIAAVPSNMASVLNNKTEGGVKAIATNTLGILSILENGGSVNSIEELVGKTIIASGQGGVPEYALRYLLNAKGINPDTDVTINWLGNHTDVMTAMLAEENSIAMLPQPFVTVALSKSEKVHAILNLNDEWKATVKQELPMGVVIAQSEFIKERKSDLNDFIKTYSDSVNLVNQEPKAASELIVKYGFISDAAVAEKAIPNCNIVMITGDENKELLNNFYKILFEMEPKSIGGKLPDEGFFY